jgi:hypothetical protein
MNQKIGLKSLLALLVLLVLALPNFAFAGDPIPGLDVKLGKNPGGALVTSGTTGQNGEVVFTGLRPGESFILTLDPAQVEIAIKEQGVKAPSTQSVTLTMTVKRGEVSVNGVTLEKKEEIDIRDPKVYIEVVADKNGEIRATVNTSRSNIKHTSN